MFDRDVDGGLALAELCARLALFAPLAETADALGVRFAGFADLRFAGLAGANTDPQTSVIAETVARRIFFADFARARL